MVYSLTKPWGQTDPGANDKRAAEFNTSLRLKWTYSAGFAGAIVAKEKGFFKERGIDVSIEPGGPELDPIKLVASGSNTFGIVGGDRLLLARQEGVPVIAIGLENRHSFVTFTALRDSGIKTPKDFEGRTVGIHHDDTYTVYQALMERARVDREKVKEVSVGWDVAPLLEHVVDVYPSYVINQPVILKNRGINVNVIKPWEYGVKFVGNVYITSETFLQEYPEAVEAFMGGLIDGWKYTYEHPEEAVNIVTSQAKELNRDEELALLSALISHIKERNVMSIDDSDFADTQNIMLKQGLLKTPLDLSSVYTDKFVVNYYEADQK